ncbi:MAG: hypothetical protein ACJAS3_003502, partial [Roseivirga sp.]
TDREGLKSTIVYESSSNFAGVARLSEGVL